MTIDEPMASDPPGRALEAAVADVYRALGYQVATNVQRAGQQIDVIAQRTIEGAGLTVVAVECKDFAHPISNQIVQDFVTSVTSLRAANVVTAGVMVSTSGFTAPARGVVEDIPYVSLFSWDDLTAQILDVRYPLQELVRDYEQQEIFKDYVDLDAETGSWSGDGLGEFSRISEITQRITSWIQSSSRPSARSHFPMFILGDYGAGKTTLLRRLQYALGELYLKGNERRIPLFVPLRLFSKGTTLASLLRSCFRDQFYYDIPYELLWRQLRSGALCFLLDGFDEMVERSDRTRRLHLFHTLLPLFKSPSPTILTSRPSYFVTYRELDSLLTLLRAREDALVQPRGTDEVSPTDLLVRADALRRSLLSKSREVRPGVGAYESPHTASAEVIRLLPLDERQISRYLVNRREELWTHARARPADVLRFIERTYDLSDLITRPLLLSLITHTVLAGAIDLSDNTIELGPSGLYELYTTLKLDLDLAKGNVRAAGLSADDRLTLAEHVALRMHAEQVLELDLDVVLDALDLSTPAARALLSVEEAITDFTTCSFLTVDEHEKCRFTHKSFREFFVARVLKENLCFDHPLLAKPLEHEVLYFLGGFAPTVAGLASTVLAEFKRAKPDIHPVARSNLFLAYLYTTREHVGRTLRDASVLNARFGDLSFDGIRLTDVALRQSTVGSLRLRACTTKSLRFEKTRVDDLVIRRSRLDADFKSSSIGSLRGSNASLAVRFEQSTVEELSAIDSLLTLPSVAHQEDETAALQEGNQHDGHIHKLETTGCLVRALRKDGGQGVRIDRLGARGSFLDFGEQLDVAEGHLQDCIVLASSTRDMPVRLAIDGSTLILWSDDDARDSSRLTGNVAVRLRAGLFGVPLMINRRELDATTLGWRPAGWGVARAAALKDYAIPDGADGYRVGDLFIVAPKWYERERAVGGSLSAVGELMHEVSTLRTMDPRDWPAKRERLFGAASAVRGQHGQLGRRSWINLSLATQSLRE